MTNSMQFSDAGCACLEQSEGKCNTVYKDSAGLASIGIGHLIKEGERFTTLTDAECYELLKQDVAVAEADVNRMVKVELNQNQFDALVCLVFNIGGANFHSSTLLKLLNAGDYKGAANEFDKWNKARVRGVLTVISGLTARRGRERALFLKEANA